MSSNLCPGFGQHSVNFHRNRGRDTAGRADPTWPNRAEYSTPCAVIPVGGTWAVGVHSAQRWERLSGLCGFCCVFSLSVSLLFLFPLFAVSVKLPLSRPTSFCLFLSILLRTPAGGRGGCVALLLPATAKP